MQQQDQLQHVIDKKSMLSFNALFAGEDDGGYCVSVPALPGCFSQGDNFEEAMNNIQEAIELYLADEPRDELEQVAKQHEFVIPIKVKV